MGRRTLARERWSVYFDDTFPPYNFRDGDRFSGMDLEIVQAILGRIGVDWEFRTLPWPRVLAALDRGDADVVVQMVGVPARFERYLMVGPFRTGQTVLAVPKESRLVFSGLDSLHGRTVGTVRGFLYTPDFDAARGFTREESVSVAQSLRKLVTGGVDAVVGDRVALAWVARREGLGDRIRFLPTVLAEVPRYIALPRGREEKAARLAQGLEMIRQDGTLARIIARWRDEV